MDKKIPKINNKIMNLFENLNSKNISYTKNTLNTEMKIKNLKKYNEIEKNLMKLMMSYIYIDENNFTESKNNIYEIIDYLKNSEDLFYIFDKFSKFFEIICIILDDYNLLKDLSDLLVKKNNKYETAFKINLKSLIKLEDYIAAGLISNKICNNFKKNNYFAFNSFLNVLNIFKINNLNRINFDWYETLAKSNFEGDNKTKLFFIFLKKLKEKNFNEFIKIEIIKIEIEMYILIKNYKEAVKVILDNFNEFNFGEDLFYLNLITKLNENYFKDYSESYKKRHEINSENFLKYPHYESMKDYLDLVVSKKNLDLLNEILNISKINLTNINKINKENKNYIIKNNLLIILNLYDSELIGLNEEFEKFLSEYIINYGTNISFINEINNLLIKFLDKIKNNFINIIKNNKNNNKNLYEINFYKINLICNQVELSDNLVKEMVLKLLCYDNFNENKKLAKGERNEYDEYIILIFDTVIKLYKKNNNLELLYLNKLIIEYFIEKSPDNFDFKIRNAKINDLLGFSFENNNIYIETTASGIQFLTNSSFFNKFYFNSLIFDEEFYNNYYNNYKEIMIQGYNSLIKSIDKGIFKNIPEIIFLQKSLTNNYLKLIIDLNKIEFEIKQIISKNQKINNDLNLEILINKLNNLEEIYFIYDDEVIKNDYCSNLNNDKIIDWDLLENKKIFYLRILIWKSILNTFFNIKTKDLNEKEIKLINYKTKRKKNIIIEWNKDIDLIFEELLIIIKNFIENPKKEYLNDLNNKLNNYINETIIDNEFKLNKNKFYLITIIIYYLKIFKNLIKWKNKNFQKGFVLKIQIEKIINDLKTILLNKNLNFPNLEKNNILEILLKFENFIDIKNKVNSKISKSFKELINNLTSN